MVCSFGPMHHFILLPSQMQIGQVALMTANPPLPIAHFLAPIFSLGLQRNNPLFPAPALKLNTKTLLMLLQNYNGLNICFTNLVFIFLIRLHCFVTTLVLPICLLIQFFMLVQNTLKLIIILLGNVWLSKLSLLNFCLAKTSSLTS
jgi:hypothetical protein